MTYSDRKAGVNSDGTATFATALDVANETVLP